MSAEKLAFLQNFYTDVTLYVPAETAAEQSIASKPPVAPEQPAATATAAAAVATGSAPAPVAPVAAPPAPPVPSRISSMPQMGYSKPSAGLERLTSSALHPVAAAAPVPMAPRPVPGAALPGVPAAPPVVPAVPPATLTPFTVMGDNQQGIILLFRLPPDVFVRLHRNVFLNKMLQALQLVMADVLLVNVEADLPVALTSLRREIAATHIVAFGKNLLDVTIRNTQIYEPVQFPSLGLSYLASATVDLVEYDVSLKKRLWPGLQAMFLR